MSVTTPVLQKGYPTKERSRGQSFAKVYLYEIDSSYVNSYLPDDNAQDPQGEEGYVFSSINVSPGNTPGTRLLTITYAPPNRGSNSSKKSVGSVTLEADNSSTEFSIESHPSWTNATFKANAETKGIKTYRAATPLFIRTEIKSASTTSISQSMIVGSIMSKGSPPGLSGATSTKWLKIGRSIRSDGDLLEVRDTYAYDANSWAGELGVIT